MSSVEFHEDEWGRHWSYAPALHGTRVRLNYPLFSSLLRAVVGWAEALSARYALHQAQLLLQSDPLKLRDAYGEDEVAPVLYSHYAGVRDEFGRPVK